MAEGERQTNGERRAIVDQLILHESLRLKPYTDSVGKITIGVGRNLSDNGLSHAEAMLLLDHDLDAAIRDCATFPWFPSLDPIRQRVLVDMAFNLGLTRLRGFRRMLRLIEEGDYVRAAHAMRNSAWARQVKTRADRLIRMMNTGEAV